MTQPLPALPNLFEWGDRSSAFQLPRGFSGLIEPQFTPVTQPWHSSSLLIGGVSFGSVYRRGLDPVSDWSWHFLGADCADVISERATSEQAAKNALMAEARDWLRKAGVE